MARIFMDGFETGDVSLWSGYNSSPATIQNTTPPGGISNYYHYAYSNRGLYKDFGTNKSELYFSFKCYGTDPSASMDICAFKDSSFVITANLKRNTSSNLLKLYLGTGTGTLLATGIVPIYGLRTYLIEIRYKPLNSGGIFTVKVDGVQDINYSGDTTNGAEEIRQFHSGAIGPSDSAYWYIDDVIVDDANWIGNTKVGIIVPDGTGTTNNWTASAGNAWDCLNEIPPVDTDYVYSNTTNQIATYAMTTIASMNTVKAVQLQGRAAYEGSPTPTKIQLGVRASGADYFATDLSPGVGFGPLIKILELNPADSAAFEQADIDALEVGVKATA